MADDIDIEEHDVLDNPIIRRIFPDISVIKNEISKYYEDVPIVKQEPGVTTDTETLLEEPDNHKKRDVVKKVQQQSSSQNISSKVTVVVDSESKCDNWRESFQDTKIILGSNSGSKSNKLKKPVQGTKIILGSKPNKSAEQTQDAEITVNKAPNISLDSVVRIPKVLLQDLGEYIYESNRYCDDCKTLFPSKFEFRHHKLKSHSIEMEKQNARNSADKNNKCNICGLYYSSKFNLIRHCKQIHQKIVTNNDNCTKNAPRIASIDDNKRTLNKRLSDDVKIKENTLRTSNKYIDRNVTSKETKSEIKVNKPLHGEQTKQYVPRSQNKCTICGIRFSTRGNLNKHFKNIHKKKVSFKLIYKNGTKNKNNILPSKQSKTTNNPPNPSCIMSMNKSIRSQSKNDKTDTKNVCFHCNEQFSDQEALIEHIYTVLEPKQYPKRRRSKTLTMVEEKNCPITKTINSQLTNTKSVLEPKQYCKQNRSKILRNSKEKGSPTTETINMQLTNTKTKGIRMKDKLIFENQDSSKTEQIGMKDKLIFEIQDSSKTEEIGMKDKLIFENQDSDESESPVSDTEIFKKYYLQTKIKTKDAVFTVNKEQIKNITDNNANRSLDQSSPKLLRKKRRHDDTDDKSSLEWDVQDTNETNKNLLTHRYNSSNKKRKLETEDIHANKLTSVNNYVEFNNLKLDSSNKHKSMKTKKANPKNRLLSMISKNKSMGLKHNNKDENSLKYGYVYECIYCTFICATTRAYCMHLFGRHKIESVTRVNKVLFDRQCKYCPRRTSKNDHNRHLHLCHNDLLKKPYNDEIKNCQWKKKASSLKHSAFKKMESFVLKSIVYKCSKCDVHFLSSCVAKDHEKHMELLINWKCSICKKIFKKHDKYLHLKQHKFSKTVNVCQFDHSELSRLLYNCTKCGIHFTEERYLVHFSKCGNQTTDSVYCKHCDILIDKRGYENHVDCHRTGKNKEDIIVITGDIITKNQEKSHSLEESYSEGESNSQKKKDEIEIVKSGTLHYSPMNCLTFCQTCKCYLSDVAVIRKSHVQGRCFKIVKYTCPTCGLVFTNKSINLHRDHHKKVKGLQLQDFEFFDLKGIQIRPPIPEYPVCNNCEVIFVGRNAVKSHICSETEYLTCEICDVKLSENAFKLHMNFHNYCMPNEKVDQSLYVVTKEPQPSSCAAVPKTNKPKDFVQTESQEQNDKLDKHTPVSSALLSNAMLTEETNNSPTVVVTESLSNTISSVIESEPSQIDNMARSNTILYTCQSCNISIDTYEKVIQHCQNHFSPNPIIPSSSKKCSNCSLKFEIDTYEIHQKLDFGCDMLQVLYFDPIYFTSDNNIWTRHIFGSVTPSIQKEPIEKSIYQHECRIKMEVVQQGHPTLNLYKCNKCGGFIDPDCLVSHIRDGCHKSIGKYPCSECGLPFISILSRTKHEKTHSQHGNVRLKSYNILLINCESHTSYNASILNAMKQYVLYQCRRCDGIVDKSQRNDHKCSVNELQKCPTCGLILYKDDFERHISKHSDLATYNAANIKVILFGNEDESISNDTLSSNELSLSFSGVVCDYKLYKCSECEECENDEKLTSRHICTFDDSKWKCPKCDEYISARSIKKHIKKHDVDAEFKTENFTVIHFSPIKDKDNSPNGTKDTHCGNSHGEQSNKRESDSKADHSVTELENLNYTLDNTENSANNKPDKESIALYKCSCGLHYMEEMVAKNHAKLCCPRMKIIRQNCSKCSLTFNPKELFSHILAHHGDKNKTFKYNVIEV